MNPTDLLVVIDETGNEDLSDPQYPLFGLGGCAVFAGQYLDLISAPWMKMKRTLFDGPDAPLHAADLRKPTHEQMEALGRFFKKHPFFRFAALVTATTNIDNRESRYWATSKMIEKFVADIGKYAPFRRAVFVFEASERTDMLAYQTFSTLQMRGRDGDEEYDIDLRMLRGTKGLCDPALEVADFVIHTAGGGTRKKIRGERMLDRLDFAAVFDSFSEPISRFLCIESVRGRPSRTEEATDDSTPDISISVAPE